MEEEKENEEKLNVLMGLHRPRKQKQEKAGGVR